MTWADYYDRFYDWAESTQVRYLSSLSSLGPADEVGEIIIELQVNVPAANRLLRKAVEAKLAFSGSDLAAWHQTGDDVALQVGISIIGHGFHADRFVAGEDAQHGGTNIISHTWYGQKQRQ